MNPETDKQLASLIEAAKQTGSDVASFIQQQAPELCEQIVAWNTWSGIVTAAIGAVFAATGSLALRQAVRCLRRGDPYCVADVGFVAGGFTLCVGLVIGGLGVAKVIKSNVAPKVVVMEAITKALNPSK